MNFVVDLRFNPGTYAAGAAFFQILPGADPDAMAVDFNIVARFKAKR